MSKAAGADSIATNNQKSIDRATTSMAPTNVVAVTEAVQDRLAGMVVDTPVTTYAQPLCSMPVTAPICVPARSHSQLSHTSSTTSLSSMSDCSSSSGDSLTSFDSPTPPCSPSFSSSPTSPFMRGLHFLSAKYSRGFAAIPADEKVTYFGVDPACRRPAMQQMRENYWGLAEAMGRKSHAGCLQDHKDFVRSAHSVTTESSPSVTLASHPSVTNVSSTVTTQEKPQQPTTMGPSRRELNFLMPAY